MTMDMWEPMLSKLPANHTIILIDNRGIGQTAIGNESTATFTIDRLTNDTACHIIRTNTDTSANVIIGLRGCVNRATSILVIIYCLLIVCTDNF